MPDIGMSQDRHRSPVRGGHRERGKRIGRRERLPHRRQYQDRQPQMVIAVAEYSLGKATEIYIYADFRSDSVRARDHDIL